MAGRALSINGVRVLRFLYGTAWKEDQTQHLSELALRQGFRGIDTANQPRHRNEAAVGQAVSASAASGLVAWEDLVPQTKFTFRRGQDHRLPYDPDAASRTREPGLWKKSGAVGEPSAGAVRLEGVRDGNAGQRQQTHGSWRTK
jgi:hypothetical protein